jgi:hypothetical protein
MFQTAGLRDRDGTGDPVRAQSEGELAREAATAGVLSFHYADRTFLRTRWQGALTLAYKVYPDLSRGEQWSAVPALFWRVSSGLDLVGQVIYAEFGEGLAAIVGRDRAIVIQAGISMELRAVLNDEVVDYESILEREFGTTFQGL